ncbi:MAG: AMP-binding protein [bacterium]|nr:AMP-dependent synthetase [Deltaproteobacteria bacterium]MCP4903829.1 AMP-binding protein [bacterium]
MANASHTVDLALSLAPDAPERLTLPHFLEDVSTRHASRIALRFGNTDTRYAELATNARRWAASLVELGVEPGERVAILISNRPEWAAAAFGAAQAGAIVVPVSTFATPEERDFILRHADASFLLMQRHLVGRDFVAELLGSHRELETAPVHALELKGLPDLRGIACLEAGEAPSAFEPRQAFLERGAQLPDPRVQEISDAVGPDDSGLMIYTSGTTDRPKGVLHSHKAAVIQSWRMGEFLGLVPEDVVFTAQPFFWTAGISMSLGATLAAGAKLLLQETFDPEAALDCIETERATTVHAWPHQEKAMAEHASAAGRDFSPLHRVEFDSALAPLAGLKEDVWGIYASYGMTETFTLASALPSWATAEERTRNSGPPLPGMEIRIVDPESGEACAVEQRGEIIVRGVTLMQRYWKVPLENVLDRDGFFHTGDGGYMDRAGLLHWKGRLSGMIKTGGANVSPLEVEKAASNLPAIKAAVAVGVPHPTLGEALVLCVVPTEGNAIDEGALRTKLRERLATYKVPRQILVIEEADAPTTGTQKLRTDAMRGLALERLAAAGTEIAGHRFGHEPRN